MRVSTPWRDAGEFVAAFSRYCSEGTCFVPTTAPRKTGIETAFSIRLVDGTPMLRGLCVVLACWTDGESPFGRAGVSLGIRKLSPHSRDIMRRMLEARPTEEMAPLFYDVADERAPWRTRWLERVRGWLAPRPSARPRLARVAFPALRLPDAATRSSGHRGT